MTQPKPNSTRPTYSKQDLTIIQYFLAFQLLNMILWSFIAEKYYGLAWSSVVLSIALLLFFVGKNTRFRSLLRAISILIFFHMLVFPWIYLTIITVNPNAIVIDNDIFSSVNSQLKADIKENYRPEEIERSLDMLNRMDSSKEIKNFKLDWLISGNLYFIDGYALKITNSEIPERNWSNLTIYDKSGRLIEDFGFKNYDFLSGDIDDGTLHDLLSKMINDTKSKQKSYLSETLKIKNKEIWTYDRILPYSINIFNSKTIKPISGFANILVFLHQIFVVVLTLGTIAALTRDILMKK
ncbi:hypothetical protein [Mucilaginibacter endophyticus]|uniref:hypothetical protein n=1 Tax=Mucilaginibacter endophyticus TaxID=2675003 RepID=UPI000E0CFF5C|nr:hypothetical protein [Mucilaginibacter endophyticus]